MKIILTSLSLLALAPLQAQNAHLLDLSQKTEIDSILKQYEEDKNLQFLALAPSVGYDPLDNSFNIGFNLSNLTNYIQTRRRNKIEISRLKVQLEEKAIRENEIKAREEENLKKAFLEFQLNFQSYLIDAMNIDIWYQLHQISQGKHTAGDITTEDFLRSKLQFSNQFKNLYNQLEKLKIQANALNTQISIPEYISILDFQSQKILQMGKNSGVLGAEPLTTIME